MPDCNAAPGAPRTFAPFLTMAIRSTVYKAELQVADMDRGHYGAYALTVARHPSENDERLMLRLLAYALHAGGDGEPLAFANAMTEMDEPDLWRRDLTGRIEQWVELGQPDESRLRKAAGRADRVDLIAYQPRAFAAWWEKNREACARLRNLVVRELPPGIAEQLAAGIGRNLEAQCFVQDGHVQWLCGEQSLDFAPVVHQAPK